MAGLDSPRLSAARAKLDAAVKEFVQVKSDERRDDEGSDREIVLVEGWAAYAEYSTRRLMETEETGNVVMVPDDQAASTARGLFEFGADAFSRVAR